MVLKVAEGEVVEGEVGEGEGEGKWRGRRDVDAKALAVTGEGRRIGALRNAILMMMAVRSQVMKRRERRG